MMLYFIVPLSFRRYMTLLAIPVKPTSSQSKQSGGISYKGMRVLSSLIPFMIICSNLETICIAAPYLSISRACSAASFSSFLAVATSLILASIVEVKFSLNFSTIFMMECSQKVEYIFQSFVSLLCLGEED